MLNRIVAFIYARAPLALILIVSIPLTLLLAFSLFALGTVGAGGPSPREVGLVLGMWIVLILGGGVVAYLIGHRMTGTWNGLVASMEDLAAGSTPKIKPPELPATPAFEKIGTAILRVNQIMDEKTHVLTDQLKSKLSSELMEEKRRFEAFLRGIGDCVTIVDTDFRIIYVNDTVKKLFGEQVGEFCYKVYEHKSEICGGCPVRRSYETGNVETSLRRVYTKEEKLLYMENTGSPIRDERGKIIAGIELARDVTQRIRLERNVEIRSRELAMANEELRITNEQLQKAYEELKAAQSALFQSEKMASLGVLVAGVAHEINNPINFVYGSMPLLEENIKSLLSLITTLESLPIPEESREEVKKLKADLDFDFVRDDLDRIVRNVTTGAQRIKQIVQNLRTFSRVDSSENSDVDIHEGIDSTLEILRHEYKNKIEIVKDYGEIPHIIGSPGKLNQVFMNIFHNAIQAIPEKGVISIRTFQESGKVVVMISDTGVGIPEDVLSKIFDPFFTTKKVGEGTGLGLSISYSIIQDHRGKLSVESTVGEGSTFRIELPVQTQAVKQEKPIAQAS